MIDVIHYGARMLLDEEIAGYGLLKGTSGVNQREAQVVSRLCENMITVNTEDLQPQWRLTRIEERTAIFLIQKERVGRIRYSFFVFLLDDEEFAHLLQACSWDLKTILNILKKNNQYICSTDNWNRERLTELIFNDAADAQAAYPPEVPMVAPALQEVLLFGALASDKGGSKIFLVMPKQEQWPAMNWLLATLPAGLASRLRAFGSATDFRQSNGAALVFIEPDVFDTCSRNGTENISTSIYRDGSLTLTGNYADKLMEVVKEMLSRPKERWEAARRVEPFVADWQRFSELLMKELEPPVEEPLYPQITEPAYVPTPEPFYPQPVEQADAQTTEPSDYAARPKEQSDLRQKRGTFLKRRNKKSWKHYFQIADEKVPKETVLKKNKKERLRDAPEGEPADRQEKLDDNTRPVMSRFLAALAAVAAFALLLLLLFGPMRCTKNILRVTLVWNDSNPFETIFASILGGLVVFFWNKVKKTK